MNILVIASSSKGNCYRISDGMTSILVEVGIPYQKIREALNFTLSDIDAALCTHSHMDHSKAAEAIMTAGVDLYCSQGCAEDRGLSGHRLHYVKDGEDRKIGTMRVYFFKAMHDAPEPLMFVICSSVTREKLLFCTDSYYIPNRFLGLNYIMVEANYSLEILEHNIANGLLPASLRNRIVHSHFSIEHLLEMLRANDLSQLKEIWLLHLSGGNSSAADFRDQVEKETGTPTYIA